jgi:arylsulfatase A-like enzyme
MSDRWIFFRHISGNTNRFYELSNNLGTSRFPVWISRKMDRLYCLNKISTLMNLAAVICMIPILWSCNVIGSADGNLAAVSESIRIPVHGETSSYQTFDAITRLEQGRQAFTISASADSVIEVGLVRIDSQSNLWGYSGKFRFKVYRKAGLGKEALVDIERNFRVGERVAFQIDMGKLGAGDKSSREIICEIEKSEKNLGKGYEAYKDFGFLAPSIFEKRKADEFNILVVSFDTLRPDHMGCYGYFRDTTPNIDAFAEKGLLFSQAISTSPWTTPAHYSLFTGLYPSAHGNKRTFNDPFSFDETIVTILKENGYYTIGVTGGGSVSSQFGFGNGFNIYREYASYAWAEPGKFADHEDDTSKTFDTALAWLEQNAEAKFFMFLHTFECHMPYEDPYFLSDDGVDNLIERRKALYDGDIRRADSFFGSLVQKLESLGLMENTIIVFLSDHGDEFYEHYSEADVIRTSQKKTIPIPEPDEIIPEVSSVDHAHSVYDELIRMPLIFYIPGFSAPKRILDSQVSMIDVMPTLLDLLDIGYDVPMQGSSLRELMRAGLREEDPPAISEFTDIGPERKSIRKDGYKYIWVEDPEKTRYYTLRDITQRELFDLNSDPKETKNIFEQNKQLAEKYHNALEQLVDGSVAINKTLRPDYKPGEGDQPQIPEDIRNTLKGLGYIQQ